MTCGRVAGWVVRVRVELLQGHTCHFTTYNNTVFDLAWIFFTHLSDYIPKALLISGTR